MSCGFRESGIGSNCLVGIRISLKLDAPLGYLDPPSQHTNCRRIRTLVGEEYVQELDEMTRTRFAENFRRRDQLGERIKKVFFGESAQTGELGTPVSVGGGSEGGPTGIKSKSKAEEKEARREAKRREGLRRQAEAQAAKAAAAAAAEEATAAGDVDTAQKEPAAE